MSVTTRLRAVGSAAAAAARLGPRDGLACSLAWMLLHAWGLRLRFARHRLGPAAYPEPWRGERPSEGPTAVPADVSRLVSLFAEAARHPAMGLWCHPRALALRQFLRVHGIEADLAVGLKSDPRDPRGLSGHAWVVYHGMALGDDASMAGYPRCQSA